MTTNMYADTEFNNKLSNKKKILYVYIPNDINSKHCI